MTQLCVHVGLPKTGTSTVQRHFFQKHPELEYLGKFISQENQYPEIDAVIDTIYTGRNAAQSTETWSAVKRAARERAEQRGKSVVLYSLENLYGMTTVDQPDYAQRIAETLQPQKIVITIRRQQDIIKSIYRHRVSRGRETIGVREYIEDNFDSVYRRSLDYSESIANYGRIYGNENICILVFEEFLKRPDIYIEKLAEFLGIENLELSGREHENKALSARQLKANRLLAAYANVRQRMLPNADLRLGRLVPNVAKRALLGYLEGGRPPDYEIPDDWKRRLDEYFAPSNRKLSDAYGLDLDKYGYPT